MRANDITNIRRIISILGRPENEIVFNYFVSKHLFNSIELTDFGFRCNRWSDDAIEEFLFDNEISDKGIEDILKQMEDLF